jgi:hypothetical protein
VAVLNRIVRAVADRADVDRTAVDGLAALLGARSVQVWRAGPDGDHLSAAAGERRPAAPAALPHLDGQGRIPPGHHRVVGGRLVLPAVGVAVDLDRAGRRVGALVVVPAPDRPVERATRAAIATAAHALATAPPTGNGDRPVT